MALHLAERFVYLPEDTFQFFLKENVLDPIASIHEPETENHKLPLYGLQTRRGLQEGRWRCLLKESFAQSLHDLTERLML